MILSKLAVTFTFFDHVVTFVRGDIMHSKTEKLRAIMAQHALTAREVADLLKVSPQTVRIWRLETTQRPIPDTKLRLLDLELKARRGA